MKPKLLPSFEVANELLSYDKDTGIFTWKQSKGAAKIGAQAGYIRDGQYRIIRINGQCCPANRLAYLLATGNQPPLDMVVDHKNEIKSDNRWENLQLVTVGENTCKKREPKCYQVTKAGTFQAVFTLNGIRHTHGTFATAEEASAVGRAARKAARSE